MYVTGQIAAGLVEGARARVLAPLDGRRAHVRISQHGNTSTVAVEGEIDLSTVDELRSAVTRAAEDGTEQVRLDLTAVKFIDSTGLGGLLQLRSTLPART